MQLHSLTIEFLFNYEGTTLHISDSILQPYCRAFTQHGRERPEELNLLVAFVQPAVRVCELPSDLLEVRASVEEVQRIRVEDRENGVFFDGDLHIYTTHPSESRNPKRL